MTRTEHLLWILAEECAEVIQRVSKAARFSAEEVQPGQEQTNAERIMYELNDLVATVEMLQQEGILTRSPDRTAIEVKKQKVEKFLLYSRECGTVAE